METQNTDAAAPVSGENAKTFDWSKLKGKKVMVCGMNEAGKTTFCKELLRQYPRHFVWDMNGEYSDKEFNRFVPSNKQRGEPIKQEFDRLMHGHLFEAIEKGRLKTLLIDESNIIAPNRATMPVTMARLNDVYRHIPDKNKGDFTVIFVTRRPAQLNTDISELCQIKIIFKLEGKNDLDWCEETQKGLGDSVVELEQYEFLEKSIHGIKRHKPLKLGE